MKPIIIAGTGLAGYNLAKEFRKFDKSQPVIMLTLDDGRNYSKPMLSTGFTKNKTADQLAMADAVTMAQQLDVDVRTDVGIATLDASNSAVTLSNGESLEYSQLVLALGAEVFRPPMAGDAAEAVFSVNDLMDYGKFRLALEGKNEVAIIGGGLIGCEFANDLTNGGFSVTVIEPLGRPLPTLLPEAASMAVQQGLEDIGVKFIFGPKATAVNHDGDHYRLSLSEGEDISADIVVSAIGLRPRISIAQAAGLAVNRGIQVDRFLRTSSPNIYALGDCSEVEGNVMFAVAAVVSATAPLFILVMFFQRQIVSGLTAGAVKG